MLNILTELTAVIQKNVEAIVIATVKKHVVERVSHDLLSGNIIKTVKARIEKITNANHFEIRCEVEFVDFLGKEETLIVSLDFTKGKKAALLLLKIRTDFSHAAEIKWYEQNL